MLTDATPIPELIARKRDGGELSAAQLRGLLHRYLDGEMDDAQMAALLMAGVLRGFSTQEAVSLTELLVQSGECIDLHGLPGPTVDKHSTGGVGDTTTLVVAPLLAAAGCQVAKLSGRGLGHTGGTLDKLAAVPGFRTDLSGAEVREQVRAIGLAITSASEDLVPADRRLYALRDVTATVPSPALIASSVMSKKIASGASTIMLDVKAGNGAFTSAVRDAVQLAELCVDIGRAHGRNTAALVTDMSQPLGDAIGNALEVAAAIEVLQGGGSSRLRAVSLALAAGTLELLGRPSDEAEEELERLLNEGHALQRFEQLLRAQGGDARVLDDPRKMLARAPVLREWSPGPGVVVHIDCRRLGEIATALGAGRAHAHQDVKASVGLDVSVRTGDRIGRPHDSDARPPVLIHAMDERSADQAERALEAAIEVGMDAPAPVPLIHERIGFAA